MIPLPLDLLDRDPQAFAAAFGASLRETGFAVIERHGIDAAAIDRALGLARAFFALSEPEKLACRPVGGRGQRGYTALGQETAKNAAAGDLKEFWHVGRELAPGHPLFDVLPRNVAPAGFAGWAEAMGGLYAAFDALGLRLVAALERHLALPRGWLADAVRDGDSVLRLLHYPPQPEPPPAGSVRAAAHEDINVITLLVGADEGGLELLSRDGGWLAVNPPPGSLVVNIGDMLARLTNDVLPSTTHRVVNPAPERAMRARFSLPFFLHFRPDFLISTLPSCVGENRPDRYPEAITAGDFLQQRLREIRLA
jgi:isopenicillin N synthase-like dioxygenase